MKQLIAFTIFTLFFYNNCHSQNDKLDIIINHFCDDLNLEKIKKMSPEKMQIKLLQIGVETREKYLNDVNEIFLDLKKENPSLNDSEINKIYSQELIFRALDICPKYKELALLPLGQCPKENKTLKKLLKEVEEVIENNKGKDYNELNNLVVNTISMTIFENRSQVEKDYQDGIASPQLMADMNNYIFHNSPDYLKMVLATQIDKAFNNK
jgi:hypothetical protein